MSASQHIESHAAAPVEDLRIAQSEVDGFLFQASRVGVALRALGDTLADEESPLSDDYRAGLCEAVGLIGDYLEGYAEDRRAMVERIAADRQAAAAAGEVLS